MMEAKPPVDGCPFAKEFFTTETKKQAETELNRLQADFESKGYQVKNVYKDIGRNDACPCGSGEKFKKCCIDKARHIIQS